jgi:glucans biosynthesis protein C
VVDAPTLRRVEREADDHETARFDHIQIVAQPQEDALRAHAAASTASMSRSSLALNNLRGVVILIVVAFHAVSAYLGYLGRGAFAFDKAPFMWRAFPIVDTQRWFGFDLFCAWQDVSLMCLMFFLSALFTWPSLKRKGTATFLKDRLLRLGVPYLFGIAIVMPIALYPVYRVSATDPSIVAYARHLFALPFWPNGPMWFLWQLLALTIMAAALHRFLPGAVETLAEWSSAADRKPLRYFIALTAAAILAYVPPALAFTPFSWSNHGLLALQLCRPLLYAVVYLAGLAVGSRDLESGLLAPGGRLTQNWARWLWGAFATYALWIALTAYSMSPGAPLPLRVAMNVSFALCCTTGCFAAFAFTLRFGAVPSRALAALSENAFGLYVLHYPFVVWLQYALVGASLFAVVKGAVVFGCSLALSLVAISALRALPFGIYLIGGERRLRGRLPERSTPAERRPGESSPPRVARAGDA